MSKFYRAGHYRRHASGTVAWVRPHDVSRDSWDRENWGGHEFSQSLKVADAQSFLERNGARRLSGCFIQPNAKCPVCGSAVFFYANSHGSRVYFDELGYPWTKHPCTDIRNAPAPLGDAGRLIRRTQGLAQELIASATIAGWLNGKNFGSRSKTDWHLAVIVDVQRIGDLNTIRAEYLDSSKSEMISVQCFSAQEIFTVEAFISVRGDEEFSFIELHSLTQIYFKANGRVDIVSSDLIDDVSSSQRRESKSTRPRAAVLIPPMRSVIVSTHDLTVEELVHFGTDPGKFNPLIKELHIVIRQYAREGCRKPRDVSARLNREGFRTNANAPWSMRLTYFLLKLLFDESREQRPEQGFADVTIPVKNPVKKTADLDARTSKPKMKSGPMSYEEMAERLSRLGRVVRQTK